MRGRRAWAQRERERERKNPEEPDSDHRPRPHRTPKPIILDPDHRPRPRRWIVLDPDRRPRSRRLSGKSIVLEPDRCPRSRSRLSSNPVAIAAPIGFEDLACRRTQSRSDYEFFFLGVICVSGLRNEIIYLFGSGENLRKCEQEVENVFSMVFSTTQPNIRKYFSQYFPKYNQTLENIFLSGK